MPAQGFAEHLAYLKVRERTSYEFALVSVAAALEMDGDTIKEARLALGGVVHRPWHDRQAEALLHGHTASPDNFRRVAEARPAEDLGRIKGARLHFTRGEKMLEDPHASELGSGG